VERWRGRGFANASRSEGALGMGAVYSASSLAATRSVTMRSSMLGHLRIRRGCEFGDTYPRLRHTSGRGNDCIRAKPVMAQSSKAERMRRVVSEVEPTLPELPVAGTFKPANSFASGGSAARGLPVPVKRSRARSCSVLAPASQRHCRFRAAWPTPRGYRPWIHGPTQSSTVTFPS